MCHFMYFLERPLQQFFTTVQTVNGAVFFQLCGYVPAGLGNDVIAQ